MNFREKEWYERKHSNRSLPIGVKWQSFSLMLLTKFSCSFSRRTNSASSFLATSSLYSGSTTRGVRDGKSGSPPVKENDIFELFWDRFDEISAKFLVFRQKYLSKNENINSNISKVILVRQKEPWKAGLNFGPKDLLIYLPTMH